MARWVSGIPCRRSPHMLDCQLYGLHPAGHYLTNVLLHAASSVLLFLVLLRMTGESLAQCLGGGGLCHSSLARRIGGLVGRATGRAEWAVFHADARSLCAVRRAPVAAALSGRRRMPCAGPDGQADARHGSLSAAVARFLAARPVSSARPAPLDDSARALLAWSLAGPAGGWWWKRSRSWPWRR